MLGLGHRAVSGLSRNRLEEEKEEGIPTGDRAGAALSSASQELRSLDEPAHTRNLRVWAVPESYHLGLGHISQLSRSQLCPDWPWIPSIHSLPATSLIFQNT